MCIRDRGHTVRPHVTSRATHAATRTPPTRATSRPYIVTVRDLVPKLATTLRGYTRPQLASDLLAGTIVGIAVSYTHLDVYKRQGQTAAPPPRPPTA